MEDNIKQCEQYYENIVDYFINQYKWKAMIIPYKDYIAGYSLFEIGKNMGFENATSTLSDFLENAAVVIKTDIESKNYHEIMVMLQKRKEDQKTRGV